jgi:hypothetical protein
MELQPHQQRVVDEKQGLDTRRDKLTEFIKAGKIFATLPADEKERLTRQLVIMEQYSAVLAERIVHFDYQKDKSMTENQIEHMVKRFLLWRLPENFNPDAGISFKAAFNEHTAYPMKHKPTGTNLFDANQAAAMVRYMVDGMPNQ